MTGEGPVADNRIDIARAIDDAPIGGLQIRVFLLCAFVAMLDGFDTQSIAFVTPVIAEDWGVDGKSFGPIFSAGLAGLMLGQLIFSMLSDRFGRRRVIILSTLCFGALTLATAAAQNWWMLLGLRFLAGFGLGGAIPNIMAITAEFAPRRIRATMVALVFGGFPLGAVLGGYLSMHLIAAFGWHAVFIAGGIAPLALVPVLIATLPESPRFLLRAGAGHETALARVMQAIVPAAAQPGCTFFADEPAAARASLASLFSDRRAGPTTMLWIAFFMSLLVIYFLMSWLPLIIKDRGLSLDTGIAAAMALNLGGALGGVVLGWLIDRHSPYPVLIGAFLSGALSIVAIGLSGGAMTPLIASVFVAGFFSVGTQTGLSAFTTGQYPTALRSTGIGAALAVGRIGSIVGPMAGGALLAAGHPIDRIFFAVAVPPLCAALVLVAHGAFSRRAAAPAAI